MKATLEFNLDDFDDKMAHLRCVKSLNLALTIWEIKREIRDKLKRQNNSELQNEIYESFNEMINERLEDNNIILDEIII
jgi:hypothetical protein